MEMSGKPRCRSVCGAIFISCFSLRDRRAQCVYGRWAIGNVYIKCTYILLQVDWMWGDLGVVFLFYFFLYSRSSVFRTNKTNGVLARARWALEHVEHKFVFFVFDFGWLATRCTQTHTHTHNALVFRRMHLLPGESRALSWCLPKQLC